MVGRGFAVDLAWDKGELTRVRIVSKSGQECAVRYRQNRVRFPTRVGAVYVRDGELK